MTGQKLKLYPIAQIERHMSGKWEMLLSQYWDRAVFNGRHQPCPLCGGKDRFRWGASKNAPDQRGKGAAICNQCGSHNGLWWFMEASGLDFAAALNEIGEHFLKIEPDSDVIPDVDVYEGPKAPRIKPDDNDAVAKYIKRTQNAPGYDDFFFECRDLIEVLRMYGK
nr:DNA primase [Klebsiella phage vB_Ko_K70PH128C1]